MRTASSANSGRTPTGDALELQEPAQEPNTSVLFPLVATDLVATLGVECFALHESQKVVDAKVAPVAPYTSGAGARPDDASKTNHFKERDFWGEVAALSNSGVVLSPNAFGAKPDMVAYAIATVSARYTSAEVKPGVLPATSGTNPTTPRGTTQAETRASSPSPTLDGEPTFEGCDLSLVLESLLDFEGAASLTEVRALDPTTFTFVRERAAEAVVASNVIKGSAMKAAQGSRG